MSGSRPRSSLVKVAVIAAALVFAVIFGAWLGSSGSDMRPAAYQASSPSMRPANTPSAKSSPKKTATHKPSPKPTHKPAPTHTAAPKHTAQPPQTGTVHTSAPVAAPRKAKSTPKPTRTLVNVKWPIQFNTWCNDVLPGSSPVDLSNGGVGCRIEGGGQQSPLDVKRACGGHADRDEAIGGEYNWVCVNPDGSVYNADDAIRTQCHSIFDKYATVERTNEDDPTDSWYCQEALSKTKTINPNTYCAKFRQYNGTPFKAYRTGHNPPRGECRGKQYPQQ